MVVVEQAVLVTVMLVWQTEAAAAVAHLMGAVLVTPVELVALVL